jgi:hypothetical protein
MPLEDLDRASKASDDEASVSFFLALVWGRMLRAGTKKQLTTPRHLQEAAPFGRIKWRVMPVPGEALVNHQPQQMFPERARHSG